MTSPSIHSRGPKRIGLLGGADTRIAAEFWQRINEEFRALGGPAAAAEVVVSCGGGAEIADALAGERWDAVADVLIRESFRLIAAGAERLVICDPALAPAADEIIRATGAPVVPLENAVADIMRRCRWRTVGFLGIQTARERQIWSEHVSVIVPEGPHASWLTNCMCEVALTDHIPPAAIARCGAIIHELQRRGAEAVVLIAPVLKRIVRLSEAPLPVLNALEVHAQSTAAWALGNHGRTRASA